MCDRQKGEPRASCLLVGRQFALVFSLGRTLECGCSCCDAMLHLCPYTQQQITLLFYMEGFFWFCFAEPLVGRVGCTLGATFIIAIWIQDAFAANTIFNNSLSELY